ncbi:MAG: CinA family protein [Opitutaceae bacterium]
MLKEPMTRDPRLTLAVAESMTGGRLQALITRESGASTFFLGGITAYSLEQKVRWLGVERAAAAAVDCVSDEVAWQMARGACERFGADLAVATTGYAEPAPVRGVAVPCVHWALCHRRAGGEDGRRGAFVQFAGAAREEAQERAAQVAYAALEQYLRQLRAETR